MSVAEARMELEAEDYRFDHVIDVLRGSTSSSSAAVASPPGCVESDEWVSLRQDAPCAVLRPRSIAEARLEPA